MLGVLVSPRRTAGSRYLYLKLYKEFPHLDGYYRALLASSKVRIQSHLLVILGARTHVVSQIQCFQDICTVAEFSLDIAVHTERLQTQSRRETGAA